MSANADESSVFVPVRSNAYSLVAGAPVAALRRRLKAASITFDHVLLESQQLRIQAGPQGSIAMPLVDEEGDSFQSAADRRGFPGRRFMLSMGDDGPGPDGAVAQPRVVINSETVINWRATLRPFVYELGPECDWVQFGTYAANDRAKKVAKDWAWTDQRNDTLTTAIPDNFVRSVVIGNANQDLAQAAHARVAVLQDSMHRRVWAQRFADGAGWQAQGFAVPVLLPNVGDLPWEGVAAIRKHKSMRDFRRIMREIESEALEAAAEGDIERAVERAARRYLSSAAGRVEGLGSVARSAFGELVVGTMLGVAAAGVTGPIGIGVGAGAGAAKAAVGQGVSNMRARKARGWVSLYQQLEDA